MLDSDEGDGYFQGYVQWFDLVLQIEKHVSHGNAKRFLITTLLFLKRYYEQTPQITDFAI